MSTLVIASSIALSTFVWFGSFFFGWVAGYSCARRDHANETWDLDDE